MLAKVMPYVFLPISDASRRIGSSVAVLAMAAVLAGCGHHGLMPSERQAAEQATVSSHNAPRSDRVRNYYATLEERLVTNGLLKTNAGADAAFSATNLTTNFERIALEDEFQLQGSTLVKSNRSTRIRRWEDPIRVSLNFGESFPEPKRRNDTDFILDYLDRMEDLTGRDIAVGPGRANFHIFVLNADELAMFGNRIDGLNLPRNQLIGAQIANQQVETLCSVFAITDRNRDSRYLAAVVIVKAEHPDLLREACYHEEIAQGMGLTNDSLSARPSIFNDNEEYAYLTHHDELLLKILYDPRIKSGMSRGSAMPLVEDIAQELRPSAEG